MASITITNHVAKGFSNKTTGTKMTWWKTSFNMPVPNIFDSNASYSETEGMLNAIGEATSFDLTGFDPGWEIVCASSVFTIYGPFAGGVVVLNQDWTDFGGTALVSNGTAVSFPSLPSGYWSSYQLATNIGVASWEIAASGTYKISAVASSAISGSTINNISFTNVPSVGTHTTGMVWVEGAQLCWTSANGHLHKVTGTDLGAFGATSGYWWIDTNYIYWIGTDGHKYRGQYNFKQFASAFSNGPSPATVSGQTSGYTWMDSNFGYEHIGYIASDGTKWIFPSGENPYA